ncbi:MAG: 1-acyl-sn-glycerol-3-phosphate acyltransferase [Treponema sp.]|nr:1-acyl-sn-glycerol-3-phosphate acyltransferase [Treponema sp.]
MSKKQKDPRYSTDDLPPIKNLFLYCYFSFMKLFFFLFFGVGSFFLAVVVIPLMKLCIHPADRFKRAGRRFISATFRFFINFMRITGVISLRVDDREKFKHLNSKVIIANHPSILDVVFIISLVPNADCIVRGGLTKTVVAGIINRIYIVNSLGYDQMVELSRESLQTGSNLIIFPEGTRTPRHGTNPYKRGAAHIAYEANCNVLPLYIGGTDKYGLGKHDPWFSYNRTERYLYDIHMLPEIEIAPYKEMESQIAARKLTAAMHDVIAAEALARDNRIV